MSEVPPPCPLRIGPLSFGPPILLAPMAGYTDTAMRSLAYEHGCVLAFTEVVNADGLIRGSSQTLHLLECGPNEQPLGGHLYGTNPDIMARAAAQMAASGRFALIDLNAGCPVRKIMAKGAGAALMRNPKLIEEIVRAMRAAVALPVTVKTRIGLSPDRQNVLELARAAEAGGASALVIHGRFASRQHRGPADWDLIRAAKATVSIPVIGNGGVNTPADAARLVRESGLDGVMVGRGAVGNPWFFEQAAAILANHPVAIPTPAERGAMIMEHLQRLIVLKQKERRFRRRASHAVEVSAVLHFRPHLLRYLAGFTGVHDLMRGLQGMDTLEKVEAAVQRILA